MKLEVFILGGQKIDQKRRDGGEARELRKGRRERGSRERREMERKRQKGIDDNLKRRGGTSPLASPCSSAPQGTVVLLQRHELPIRFCSKALQQCEYSPAEQLGKGSGPKRLVKY